MNHRALRTFRVTVCSGALAVACSIGAPATAHATPTPVQGSAAKVDGFMKAGPRGAVYHLSGGSTLRLSAGALVRFTGKTKLKLGHPNGPSTGTQMVNLKAGRADIEVPDSPTALAVLVHGPRKVSAVGKASRYSVIAGDGTTVVAREGKILHAVGDTWRPLNGGKARSVTSEGASPTRDVVSRPQLAMKTVIALVIGEGREAIEYRWNAVKGAARYEVEVYRGKELLRTIETKAPSARIDALAAGIYEARVRAYDAHGVEGAYSEKARARIAGVKLPPGSFVTPDGAIQLGKRQSVELVATDGLLVGFGESERYMPAPRMLSMSRNRPLSAYLKEPGKEDRAQIRLEPKSVRADVVIGPHGAKWPRDEIRVQIKLRDTRGRHVPKSYTPKARVTVNVRDAKVRWQRSGDVLRGVVRAPQTKGPWVVRVEVDDEQGDSIGRSFLEVADGTASPRTGKNQKSARR